MAGAGRSKRSPSARRALCALLALLALFPTSATSGSIWERRGVEPYRLPLDRVWLSRGAIQRPHHNHPSTDLYVPVGTIVYAAQAGKVRAIISGSSCGLGVVIDGHDGYRYTYCHASRALVSAREMVHSGDRIMRTGNSSSGPHLHFEIEDARLRLKCPQPLVFSWWRGGQKTPADAPYGGCSY